MKKSGVRRGVLVYKGPDPAGKMEIPDKGPSGAGKTKIPGKGVSLEALGRIPLLVHVRGKAYRGHLVRAVPMDSEWTSYAIALDEDCDL